MSTQVTNSALVARNRVMIRGNFVAKEGIANAAITPGHLVKRLTTDVDKVLVHATAGGNAQPLFALELDFYGGGTDALLAIDEAYAASDNVKLAYCAPGAELWALLAANASAITIGDPLESAGDGTLRKHTPPSQAVNEAGSATYTIAPKTQAIVAYALQTIDNSAVAATARIRVEIA